MNDTESIEWTVPQFEQWLRVGVESYVLEDVGCSAFPEAAADLLEGGSLALGVKLFVQELGAKQLQNYKQAVANALASLEPLDEYVPVANALLEIAVATNASPVLHVLSGKIGKGFFGQPDPTARTDLFSTTLYAVERLGAQGREDALKCMHSLIESPNFQSAHAGIALLALCKIDPTSLVSHLEAPGLRKRLQEQFEQFDTDGSLRRKLAHSVLDRIQLTNLKAALPGLQFGDTNNPGRSADDWLVDALFLGPASPLILEGGKLHKRNDPDIGIPISNIKVAPGQDWEPPLPASPAHFALQHDMNPGDVSLLTPLLYRRGRRTIGRGLQS